jgi:hypothetical protein
MGRVTVSFRGSTVEVIAVVFPFQTDVINTMCGYKTIDKEVTSLKSLFPEMLLFLSHPQGGGGLSRGGGSWLLTFSNTPDCEPEPGLPDTEGLRECHLSGFAKLLLWACPHEAMVHAMCPALSPSWSLPLKPLVYGQLASRTTWGRGNSLGAPLGQLLG